MSSLSSTGHSSVFADAAASSFTGSSEDFKCPRCDRHCKSRTWFLRHLEACLKGPSSPNTHSNTAPSEGSANIIKTADFGIIVDHQHRRLSRRSLPEDVTSSFPLESVKSVSPSNTRVSHPHSHTPPPSTPVAGEGCGEALLSDLIGAGEGLTAEFWRNSSSNCSGCRDRRGSLMHKTPTPTLQASSHRHGDELHVTGSASSPSGGGGGGSILVSGLSRATMPAPRGSSCLGSPHGAPTSGSGRESGTRNASAASGCASAAAPGPASSSFHLGRCDKGHDDGRPALQDSFRLQSGRSWMQYTPSGSEDEGDNPARDGHGEVSHRSNRGQSLRKAGFVQGCSDPAAREAASSFCSPGAERVVSPGGADRSPDRGVHARQCIGGGNYHGSDSASGPGDASFSSLTGMLPSAGSAKEVRRRVPRLLSRFIDVSPPERNGGDAADGRQHVGSGASIDRFYSRRNSVSLTSFSQSTPLVFPTPGQTVASPNSQQANVLPASSTASFGSVSRLSGLNLTSTGGGGGVRTPRQGERSGSITPRAISFQRGRVVGSGGFGTVYQAILSDGSLAAVKELKLENENFKAIDREVRAMSGIPPHPNCVRYLGSRHSAHHYYIIMEYISGGSIKSLRGSVGRFRESVFQRYAYMVLLGLSHLHANGIVHRDIKGANVLLDESGCAKIVDFGCSRDLNQTTTSSSAGGTPLWMAPEVCRGEPTTEKSDVWSYGCLCLEMTNETGLPWSFLPSTTLQGVVYALACAKSPPAIPTDLSSEAQDFLQRCLRLDPEERATVAELLQHPFFDLDVMEDSEGDELLSSCGTSARQSAVKRAVREMNRSSAVDAATRPNEERMKQPGHINDMGGDGGGNNAPGSPLMPAFTGLSLSPQGGQSNSGGHVLDPDANAASRSSYSHSKSPSGPQLDYYTRSVNSGFRLQAVNEDEEDGGDTGEGEGNVASSIGLGKKSPPPPPPLAAAVPEIALAERGCRAAGNCSGLEEDEYTQMITEMITDAREAYTDEERRMTERWRRRNVLYESSDEDTSVTATVSSHESHNASSKVNDSGSSSEAVEGTHHDDSESSLSTLTSSDEDGGCLGSFASGLCHRALGETWPARTAHSSPLTDSSAERQDALKDVPQHPPTSAMRATDAGTPAASVSSGFHVSLPGFDSRSSVVRPGNSPTSVNFNPVEVFPMSYTFTPSGAPGLSPRSQSQQSSRAVLHHSTLATCSRGQPPQQRPGVAYTPRGNMQEVSRRDYLCDASGSRGSMSFGKSSTESLVDAAAGAVTRSPQDSRDLAAMSMATRHPRCTSSSSPHASVGSAVTPRLFTTPAAQCALPRCTVPSDYGGSCRTSPQPRPLIVGGPHRHTSPQQSASTTPSSSAHTHLAFSAVEWCTGGGDRLDAGSAIWHTGASGHQPKELSIAQKEMQEMLDWRSSGDQGPTYRLPSADPGRRCSKRSSATTSNNPHSRDGSYRHSRLRRSRRSHGKYVDLEYNAEAQREAIAGPGSTGLSATETVSPGPQLIRRKPSGIRIFRKLRSK